MKILLKYSVIFWSIEDVEILKWLVNVNYFECFGIFILSKFLSFIT